MNTLARRPRNARRAKTVLGPALALLAGCVGLESFVQKDATPVADICQVVPIWDPRVTYTPDPARGGVPAPGLVGRLYLFGPNVDFPKVGDGGVVVDLYNETPAADGKSHVLLEQWRFDPDTLKRLLKRDMIGWGYTLFLPWGTCSPAVTHVQLQLRYEPRKGAPLFAPPISLTLEHAPPAGPAAEPVAQRGPVPPRPAAADQSSGKPAGLIPAAGRHARNEVTGAGEPSRPSLRSGPGHPE